MVQTSTLIDISPLGTGSMVVRVLLAVTGEELVHALGVPRPIWNLSFHQHLFRPRFYEAAAGGISIAQFASDFVNGTVSTVGP